MSVQGRYGDAQLSNAWTGAITTSHHPLSAGLAAGRQVSVRTRPESAHRGARLAHVVRLLRERVPAARSLPHGARLTVPPRASRGGTCAFTSVEESFSPLERARRDRSRWLRLAAVARRLLHDDDDRSAVAHHGELALERRLLPRALPAARADIAWSLVESDPRIGVTIVLVEEARAEVVAPRRRRRSAARGAQRRLRTPAWRRRRNRPCRLRGDLRGPGRAAGASRLGASRRSMSC